MQPPCLYISTLGTAFLRRSASASYSRHHKSFTFPVPNPLNTRQYSNKEPQITINNDKTKKGVERQPLSNGTSDIPIICAAPQSSSGSIGRKPGHGYGSPECGPMGGPPDLDTGSMPGQETGWQEIWRMIWRTKKMPGMAEGRQSAEELRRVLEDQHTADVEIVQALRVPRKERKRLGKKQRAKRGKARIRNLLEAVEYQLDVIDVRIEAFRQLAVVKKLLGIINKHLEIERQKEIWRQLDLAEKRSVAIERKLESIGRRIETWRQFELAAKRSETIGKELDTIQRRIGTRRQFDLVERQLDAVGEALHTIQRRIELWKRFDLAERRSEILERELHMMLRRIETWILFDLAEKQLEAIGRELEAIRRRLESRTLLVTVEQGTETVERELSFIKWQLAMFRRPTNLSNPARTRSVGRRQRQRRMPIRTSEFLTGWLSTPDTSKREQYWLKSKGCHRKVSLPLLLVAYLRLATNPNIRPDAFDRSIIQSSTAALQQGGFTVNDLAEWAWIVSAQDTQTIMERFFSSTSRKPTFLLIELLKRDSLDVRSLKLLLIYSWDQLLRIPSTNLAAKSEVEIDSAISWSTMLPLPGSSPARYTQSSFLAIFHLLLRQARRIWPAAVVSISHMAESFIRIHLGSGFDEVKKVDGRRHARLCKLYNQTLCALALPSSINPLKSMVYNWQAQRVLLEMSTRFEPPLLLDRNSYRAVARVLAASKKSERESRAATLRTRSWPPWRVVQDGMDAQRSLEDDLTRAVITANQAKGSGYSEETEDRIIRVIGGQEPDGTPTIPTRNLVRRLSSKRLRWAFSEKEIQYDRDVRVWASRITSTRDIQEAWAAFLGCQEQGLQPTMSMYHAMFVKLHYEARRSTSRLQPTSSPGDGKEVFEPSNDNFSSFYQSRLRPPSIDDLYKQMRHAGVRASGRFLAFLVSRARTPFDGIKYLLDSRVDRRAVAFFGGVRTENPVVLKFISEEIFAAFIKLLCRLAPRLVPATESSAPQDEADNAQEKSERAAEANGWRFIDLRRNKHLNSRIRNPLLHCAKLLNISQIRYRPAWYALFAGLVRRGVVVDRSLIGDPKNDIVAWKVLVAALGDFHRYGLELDPAGFQILCIGLEKALLASFQIPENERESVLGKDQVNIVIAEFKKLSEVKESRHPSIPKLLHPIEGSHLHHYIRVLGISQDYDGLMNVLRWMVKYNFELDEIVSQSRNGSNLIQRALIALKVFLGRTKYEAEAEELVNSVEGWGGWPVDIEAQRYTDRWSGCRDRDESESSDEEESEEE